MPIHKVSGGYKWGSKGKTYPTRAGAAKQAAAAYASGYQGRNMGGPIYAQEGTWVENALNNPLQAPTASNAEELKQVVAARDAELANVAAELGITREDLQKAAQATAGSSADQANAIAAQIWGDNAPQLRQGSAAEIAADRAGVLAELARQNPNWGGGQAAGNAIDPAKPQGFLSWAAEQAGDAWDSAGEATGSAFQSAVDYATGETARKEESAQHQQMLDQMTPEQLVEYLDNKYNTGAAPAVPSVEAPPAPVNEANPEGIINPETGQPYESRGFLERAGDFAKSLNPIGEANAANVSPGAMLGLAGVIPNPTLANAPVFQGGLNVGGAMGGQVTGAGGERQAPFQQEFGGHEPDKQYDAWQHSQAYGAKPATQRWEKGWFSDGFVETTPEERAREQMGIDQAQFQADRFFLDRDNQGYGAGQVDPALAEATRAQGDFNTTGGWNDNSDAYDGGRWDQSPSYQGFDDGDDDSDWDDWEDDFDVGGSSSYEDDVESDVGTNTYASPYEQGQDSGGGGDDSGGGGK